MRALVFKAVLIFITSISSVSVRAEKKSRPEKLKHVDQVTRSVSNIQPEESEPKYPSQNDPEYYFSCYDKAGNSKNRCE